MRITLTELKSIIKEEVESMKLYNRWKQLRSINRTSPNDNVMLAASADYYDNLPLLFQLKASTKDYFTFLDKVRKSGFNLPADRISDFYDSSYTSPEELAKDVEDYGNLKSRFKIEKHASETDRMYGRTSFKVIDTLTGQVVDQYYDRPGSLGT